MMTSHQSPWTHIEMVSCSQPLLLCSPKASRLLNVSHFLSLSFFLSCFLALDASGSAASAGIVGPLSLGEDELAHAVGPGGVKNLDVAAPMEIQGPICHPKSIISFKGDQRCVTVHPSGSHAVSVCSFAEGMAEDRHLPTTTTGVTEVVAMAEVSVTEGCDLQSQ